MEQKSFEALGGMAVPGGAIGWLAAGQAEALARKNGAQGLQSRMRQRFLTFLREQAGVSAPDCMVCSNSRRDFYTGILAGRLNDLCAQNRTIYMGYYDVQTNPAVPRLLWWTAVPARELSGRDGTQRNGSRYLIRVPERVMAERWSAAEEKR